MGNTDNTIELISLRKPIFMLISKISLLATVVLLYVMQSFVSIPIFALLTENNDIDGNLYVDKVLNWLMICLIAGVVPLIFAIIGAIRRERPVMVISIIAKALMIPFFCINLTLWIFLFSGMLNPFLFLGIPFAGAAGLVLTYIYMLMTGLPDVVYAIIFCIRNKRKPTIFLVAGSILNFIFVLDLVGSILLNIGYKRITTKE